MLSPPRSGVSSASLIFPAHRNVSRKLERRYSNQAPYGRLLKGKNYTRHKESHDFKLGNQPLFLEHGY